MESSALLADVKVCTTSKNFDRDDVQGHALGLDQPLVCGTISVGYQTSKLFILPLSAAIAGRPLGRWLS